MTVTTDAPTYTVVTDEPTQGTDNTRRVYVTEVWSNERARALIGTVVGVGPTAPHADGRTWFVHQTPGGASRYVRGALLRPEVQVGDRVLALTVHGVPAAEGKPGTVYRVPRMEGGNLGVTFDQGWPGDHSMRTGNTGEPPNSWNVTQWVKITDTAAPTPAPTAGVRIVDGRVMEPEGWAAQADTMFPNATGFTGERRGLHLGQHVITTNLAHIGDGTEMIVTGIEPMTYTGTSTIRVQRVGQPHAHVWTNHANVRAMRPDEVTAPIAAPAPTEAVTEPRPWQVGDRVRITGHASPEFRGLEGNISEVGNAFGTYGRLGVTVALDTASSGSSVCREASALELLDPVQQVPAEVNAQVQTLQRQVEGMERRALNAERALNTLQVWRDRLAEDLLRKAEQLDWCSDYDEFARDHDLPVREQEYEVTVDVNLTRAVTVTVNVTAADEDAARDAVGSDEVESALTDAGHQYDDFEITDKDANEV